MPARVLVLPVMDPTMMQRGLPAGLLTGACFKSSSSRLTSRKWPRWFVLQRDGTGQPARRVGGGYCAVRVEWPGTLVGRYQVSCSIMRTFQMAWSACVATACWSLPNGQLKAISRERWLLGGGQVNRGIGHKGVEPASTAQGAARLWQVRTVWPPFQRNQVDSTAPVDRAACLAERWLCLFLKFCTNCRTLSREARSRCMTV